MKSPLPTIKPMKKLLFAFALSALPFLAHAQSTTNLTYRIQVESVTAGVTNTTTTNWRYDAGGTKKDTNRLAGVHYAYGVYLATVGTNTPLAMGVWLKNAHVMLIDDYATQKVTADNAAIATKIQTLLTTQSDLLSTAQLNQLAAIAALLP